MSSGIVLTMSGTATAVDTTTGAYNWRSNGLSVHLQRLNGQLTVNQNSTNTLINVTQGNRTRDRRQLRLRAGQRSAQSHPTGAASQIRLTPSAAAARCRRRPTASFPMTRTSPTLRGWRWSRRVNGSTWLTRGTTPPVRGRPRAVWRLRE